ncbi:MAG: SIS domain-containing protein [Brevundimonas sp.]|uniref:SIS domain-containing protein n=1 Tax=Brevundimonas sp. TaxID=1871086 RepID=UPI003919C0D1
MRAEDTRMFHEAAAAGEVVATQLARNAQVMAELGDRLRHLSPTIALISGRGSSDNAGVYARYLIETGTGVPTSPAALSASSVYDVEPRLKGAVCIAISQSGQSPDLVASVSAARAGGAFVIALVNAPDSRLAAVADVTVPLHAGAETSVAATKSFIASLSALAQLIGCWTGDDALLEALDALPDQLDAAFRQDWSPALETLVEAQSLYVVGRGPGYAVAREAALKLKETCGLHAEAFSAAEIRHGPMALVKTGFPVLMLAQDDETRADMAALAAEFADRDARVMLAGAQGGPSVTALRAIDAHPAIQPILLIQSFYRLAAMASVARGYDPDRPPFLNKVTETL